MVGKGFGHSAVDREGSIPVPVFFAVGDQPVVIVKMMDDRLKERVPVGDRLSFRQRRPGFRIDAGAALLGQRHHATVFLQWFEDIALPDPRQILFILVAEHEARDRVSFKPWGDLEVSGQLIGLEDDRARVFLAGREVFVARGG